MPGIVFLGANTPWVYALAAALAKRGHPVAAVAAYDLSNFLRLRPRWPGGTPPAQLQRAVWVYPPGYVGTLAPLFAPLLGARLNRTSRALKTIVPNGGTCAPPWVVAPYPWFHRALRSVFGGRLIYYNLDDYSLYQPSRTSLIRRQEDELLRRATLTLCLAQRQVDTLRARVPADRAENIRHFPLGVAEGYLNPYPERIPAARTVGYVGNLIDRVDWQLVAATARALPDVEFIFVGGLKGFGGGGARPDWQADRTAAFALPNVRRIGLVRQENVPGHYWSFAVNWIPYATDHAFNQAACPTKIMDGLASGRPVISTILPECRLYPAWITVVPDSQEMVRQLLHWLSISTTSSAVECATRQVAYARSNIWKSRAETLAKWMLTPTRKHQE